MTTTAPPPTKTGKPAVHRHRDSDRVRAEKRLGWIRAPKYSTSTGVPGAASSAGSQA